MYVCIIMYACVGMYGACEGLTAMPDPQRTSIALHMRTQVVPSGPSYMLLCNSFYTCTHTHTHAHTHTHTHTYTHTNIHAHSIG